MQEFCVADECIIALVGESVDDFVEQIDFGLLVVFLINDYLEKISIEIECVFQIRNLILESIYLL
jgi:hypothetical protein